MHKSFAFMSAAAIAGFMALGIPVQAQAHGGWGGGGWHGGWRGGGWGGWRGGFYGGWAGFPYVAYAYPYPYAYSYAYPPAYSYYPSYPSYAYYGAAPAMPGSGQDPQAPPGYTCYAGRYVCPLEVAHPINGTCHCPTGGNGSITGTAR